MKPISRRHFIKFGLAGAGSLTLAGWDPLLAATTTSDDHFFLVLVLNGAADSSYMFDARPLSMTRAGKIQNYWSKNNQAPLRWEGVNGGLCLSTPLIQPLIPYRDRFSVLNGVCMTPTFDGHLQNMNFLFTGNPFGGDSFLPHLNLAETGRQPDSLDAINPGVALEAVANNHSRVVPLKPESVGPLAAKLKQSAPPLPGTELMDFIRLRQTTIGQGTGRISRGASLMYAGIDAAPALQAKLAQLSPATDLLALIGQSFRLRISRSAVLVLPEAFDVHAADNARKQPAIFSSAIRQIADTFKFLINTPFDSQRALIDVTTVLVASEMGRTLRVDGEPIDNTGTNHNQFSNSFLIGGKGIRSNMVIGQSDMPDENAPISKAHLSMDPILEKTMGYPFDFSTMTPRLDLPDKFDVQEYLTVGSIINTILASFNVPQSYMRTLGRGLPTAPVLSALLR